MENLASKSCMLIVKSNDGKITWFWCHKETQTPKKYGMIKRITQGHLIECFKCRWNLLSMLLLKSIINSHSSHVRTHGYGMKRALKHHYKYTSMCQNIIIIWLSLLNRLLTIVVRPSHDQVTRYLITLDHSCHTTSRLPL